MIMAWIGSIIGLAALVACIVWLVWAIRIENRRISLPKWVHVGGAFLTIVMSLALMIGPLYWLYGTASGQRELKSFTSDTGGGLPRVVEVYDLQGDLIKTYEGTFDIQEDSTKVFFDLPQEDGSTKRVQIYNGTVVVEEQ